MSVSGSSLETWEIKYCKVASYNTSRLEAHAGFRGIDLH